MNANALFEKCPVDCDAERVAREMEGLYRRVMGVKVNRALTKKEFDVLVNWGPMINKLVKTFNDDEDGECFREFERSAKLFLRNYRDPDFVPVSIM